MHRLIGAFERFIDGLSEKAETVFLGDSITAEMDFKGFFPEKSIAKIAPAGFSLSEIKKLTGAVVLLKPKKVFILGGINGLKEHNFKVIAETYREMVEEIKALLPKAQVYIESVLPVSDYKEDYACKNTVIESFNEMLINIAVDTESVYVDLYSEFLENGGMKTEYTRDGIHLSEKGNKLFAEILKKYL